MLIPLIDKQGRTIGKVDSKKFGDASVIHWVKDRDEQNPLAIDHCHKTGKIRGLLCFSCNIILGHVEEKQNRLQNLIDYLQKHG